VTGSDRVEEDEHKNNDHHDRSRLNNNNNNNNNDYDNKQSNELSSFYHVTSLYFAHESANLYNITANIKIVIMKQLS
jgi:hypothetical protein